MADVLVPPTFQHQPNQTTSERLLELKKKVATLERKVGILESDWNKQAKAMSAFTNLVNKTIRTLEKELVNHVMNTDGRR